MSNRLLFRLIMHLLVACVGGTLLGAILTIIFWNNDGLFMWHWISVPISMLYMGIMGFHDFIRFVRGKL